MIIPFPKRGSPTFFLDHYKAVLSATALLVFFCYFMADAPLAEHFETLSSSTKIWAKRVTNLIDPKYNYFVWAPLFFFLRFVLKKVNLGNLCLLIAISVPLANLAATIIKWIAGRMRPDLLFTKGLYGFTFFGHSYEWMSFPSAHACTAGAIFGALAAFYPRYSYHFAALALLLAFTRVILTAHFLGDVIAGAAVGLLTAQSIYKVMHSRS